MGRVAERAWIAPNLDRPKVPISTGHFRPIASADPQKMCIQSPPSCFASSQASAQHLDLSVIEPATDGCLGSLDLSVIEPATDGCLGFRQRMAVWVSSVAAVVLRE
jgi:hypothetical protein